MNDKKESILNLFFNANLEPPEIVEKMKVSKQYVSQVLNSDSRYKLAKKNKKESNAIKRKEYMSKYFKTYQRRKQEDNSYEQLKALQNQDALELSYASGNISDYDFVKWNSSAYHRDKDGNLALNKGLNVGFDVPKKVNMNIKVPPQKNKCYCR